MTLSLVLVSVPFTVMSSVDIVWLIDHAFSSSTTVLPTLTTGSESSLVLYFSSPRRETIAIAASYTEALYRSK